MRGKIAELALCDPRCTCLPQRGSEMDSLKEALRRFAKAVFVVTTVQDGVPMAMTATAICEVSMAPPSMLVCINKSASLYPALTLGAQFALSILHHTQARIASNCAGAVTREQRFAEGEWLYTDVGVPYLVDAQASIICRTANIVDHGTHGIFIGEVSQVLLAGRPDPLVYLDGQFTRGLVPLTA